MPKKLKWICSAQAVTFQQTAVIFKTPSREIAVIYGRGVQPLFFFWGEKFVICSFYPQFYCTAKDKGSPEKCIIYLPPLTLFALFICMRALSSSEANSRDGQAACLRSQRPKVSRKHSCRNWHTTIISAY